MCLPLKKKVNSECWKMSSWVLRTGKWLNASAYMSVIRRLVGRPTSVLLCFDNPLATFVSLTCSHQFHRLVTKGNKGRVMCYHVYVIMHVKSLAILRKSRSLCPISRLLSVPIWPACAKQGR